jgi:hypothetical protein
MNFVEPGTPIAGSNKIKNSLDFPGVRTPSVAYFCQLMIQDAFAVRQF